MVRGVKQSKRKQLPVQYMPREGGLAITLTEKLEDMVSIIFLPLVRTRLRRPNAGPRKSTDHLIFPVPDSRM